ncbi:PREDICTED: uncharacterized protein LOC109581541 [Amphimedon queenslandica]|uniref:Uncharacterized protein n=1 Tax=Amphimedon queenslandica TaxID=400682 RepID=A0A1X7V0F7_AMPQE|nr:PREDICTED: uncharacterized protein LOC109581541 [Amphimedon queenslandica]|eukprot:XP_019851299.1 PREDICTED: uncharacterized protein LOC109581541 [Amphimedon queenslandica]
MIRSRSIEENPALKKLEEAEYLLNEDTQTIKELNLKIKEENKNWDRQKAGLDCKRSEVKKSIKKLEGEKEHVDRLTSSSRDARKMYGDMTPGDTTHQDVTLAYQNHFKSAQRNMPKKITSKDKYEVWEDCAQNVQDAFDDNRKELIQKMLEKVQDAVLEDHKKLDETTYDLQRAFQMFLQAQCSDEKVQEDIIEEITNTSSDEEKEQRRKEVKIVMDILMALHPDDYIPFINDREPRKRQPQEIMFDQEQ